MQVYFKVYFHSIDVNQIELSDLLAFYGFLFIEGPYVAIAKDVSNKKTKFKFVLIFRIDSSSKYYKTSWTITWFYVITYGLEGIRSVQKGIVAF